MLRDNLKATVMTEQFGFGAVSGACEGFEHCVERVKRSGNKRMVGLEKGQQRRGRSGNYQRVQVFKNNDGNECRRNADNAMMNATNK